MYFFFFNNTLYISDRHYHWRKAVLNKGEIALLKKIQLVSKCQDNFKCWVLLLFFSLVLSSHTHTHVYIYIYGTFSIADFFFVNAAIIQNVIYILWREISLSLTRGCHILFSCQFFSSLFFVRHPIIFQAC